MLSSQVAKRFIPAEDRDTPVHILGWMLMTPVEI